MGSIDRTIDGWDRRSIVGIDDTIDGELIWRSIPIGIDGWDRWLGSTIDGWDRRSIERSMARIDDRRLGSICPGWRSILIVRLTVPVLSLGNNDVMFNS